MERIVIKVRTNLYGPKRKRDRERKEKKIKKKKITRTKAAIQEKKRPILFCIVF